MKFLEFKEEQLIKQFKFDKSKQALIHPFTCDRTKISSTINVYLLTIGHLWIYKLIETNGYLEFVSELIDYALKSKNDLMEWNLTNKMIMDINSILKKYNLEFKGYANADLDIFDYKKELTLSKDKEHPYHRLTRLLLMSKEDIGKQIFSFLDSNIGIEAVLREHGAVINAAYLGFEVIAKQKGEEVRIPDILVEIIENNMHCETEYQELKYYPKMDVFIEKISNEIDRFSVVWYTLPSEEQVIISKLLFSFRLLSELSVSLIGMNGLLSTFVTRALFDNYWQTKYLLVNNEVDTYRRFALDRMRLHVLKRTERDDISNIDILFAEMDGDLFDPIPIHGDYFSKSAREYSIQLDIKDEYDKYYEYNSEFIHASLTAVYSGLMVECENPEHNRHLTINPSASRYIDSMKHIFEIINLHILLINTYMEYQLIEPFVFNDFFFTDRNEFSEFMRSKGV